MEVHTAGESAQELEGGDVRLNRREVSEPLGALLLHEASNRLRRRQVQGVEDRAYPVAQHPLRHTRVVAVVVGGLRLHHLRWEGDEQSREQHDSIHD